MAKKRTTSKEDSVNMALKDLMGIEEDRQATEEEAQREREQKELEMKQEAERQRREEEEQKLKAEEAARKAAEEEKKREEETAARQKRELELRVLAQSEVEARAREHRRMLEFELEVKRISASSKKNVNWVWPFVAVLVVTVIAVSALIVSSISTSADSRVNFVKEQINQIKVQTNQELSERDIIARDIKDKNERLKNRIADLQTQLKNLQAQPDSAMICTNGNGKKQRPKHNGQRNRNVGIEKLPGSEKTGKQAKDDPTGEFGKGFLD